MKKVVLLLLLSALFSIDKSYSQGANGPSYRTAIGIKFYPGAFSIKHFHRDNRALEGLLYFWNYGFRVTGLYEIHGDISDLGGLKWYIGPGAHIGVWNNRWKDAYPTRESGVAIGVDGVLGLDYKINGAPINLSLDWQPSFTFSGYSYFEGGWGGLGIRYTIK